MVFFSFHGTYGVHGIMILSGASIIKREIVRNLLSAQQIQPCGVDLSLRRVLNWTSPATIDFDNSRRQAADTSELPFHPEKGLITLRQGSYLVEFNETARIPLDCMGQIFVRSSLWRSGALLSAGVIDAGYEGALGALLDVRNPGGITLYMNAKLGQITLHTLDEKVEGYSGIYQFSSSTLGRDGQVKD
jgi:dUTP pyrophosphatase